MTVVSRWRFDGAIAARPQSGLAWSCFLFPLIEPDWQISRIRLSEKTHAFDHGRFAVPCGNWTKPYTEFRDASGKRLYAGRRSLLGWVHPVVTCGRLPGWLGTAQLVSQLVTFALPRMQSLQPCRGWVGTSLGAARN